MAKTFCVKFLVTVDFNVVDDQSGEILVKEKIPDDKLEGLKRKFVASLENTSAVIALDNSNVAIANNPSATEVL